MRVLSKRVYIILRSREMAFMDGTLHLMEPPALPVALLKSFF